MSVGDATKTGDDEDDDACTRRKVLFLMCFFHMMKGVRENRSKLKTKGNYGEILRDLRALHIVPHPCEDAFEYFLSLFYEKWTERGESEFVEYFKKYWGGSTRRWSRAHHPPGYAAANNGLESRNRWLKAAADYKRKDVRSFIQFMVEQLRAYSVRASNSSTNGGVATPSTRKPLPQKVIKACNDYRDKDRKKYGIMQLTIGGISKFNWST